MPGTELDFSELPLKRLKLGPPDVYKQDAKQKEDELSTSSIKEGFRCVPVVQDEFALARDLSSIGAINKRDHDRSTGPSSRGLSMQTIGMSLSAIVTRKAELCALADTTKRRTQLGKENFFLVHQKTRQSADTWLADLSAAEPLSRLFRSIPIFNKREDIFTVLCDHNVPPARAMWYIKLVNVYQTMIATTDVARRPMAAGPGQSGGGGMGGRPLKQPSDPCAEWTGVFTRFLQDLLDRIDTDFAASGGSRDAGGGSTMKSTHSSAMSRYAMTGHQQQISGGGGSNTSSSSMNMADSGGSGVARSDLELWQYTARLCNVMFQEHMLDPHELLSWMIELLHKSNFQHDNTLRLVIVFVMNYLEVFSMSHFLTRRLAYVCCILIRRLYQSSSSSSENSANLAHCTRHRLIFAGISNILQYLLVANPHSFVWNDLGDIFNLKRPNSLCPVLYGSPLDDLPCLPSSLPVISGSEQRLADSSTLLPRFFFSATSSNDVSSSEEKLRSSIANAERCVVVRSKAYELFRDPLGILATISPVAVISRRVAELLVRLDRHSFTSNVGVSSLSHLYSLIPSLKWRPSSSDDLSSSELQLFVAKSLRTKSPLVDAEHCAVVTHLLLWAVTPQADSPTAGIDEYRWLVATRLLASVRQTSIVELHDLVTGKRSSSENNEEQPTAIESSGNSSPKKNSTTMTAAEQCVDEVIQEELFDFIGSKLAPILSSEPQLAAKVSSLNGDCGSSVSALILRNAIHLFAELVENGLFSPTAFMNSLVARGYLPQQSIKQQQQQQQLQQSQQKPSNLGAISSPPNVATPMSVTSWPPSTGPASLKTPTKVDSVKEPDSAASAMMSPGGGSQSTLAGGGGGGKTDENATPPGVISLFDAVNAKNDACEATSNEELVNESVANVYSLFLLHFPFPYNRAASMSSLNSYVDSSTRRDEENQRGILLFGVGQKRQAFSKAVRKAVRELQRWFFSKRQWVDIHTGQLASSKSSKKSAKGAEKQASCSYSPSQQAALRIWSSDVAWHDRMAILESVANNDALSALRQLVDTVVAAGATPTRASFSSESSVIPHVPSLSSIFRLTDLFIRAQSVRPAMQFASCILRCCPAIWMLASVYGTTPNERYARHYANDILLLGVALCRRFFMCILAAPDLCISASYALLNAIIAAVVSPAALLFGGPNSQQPNGTAPGSGDATPAAAFSRSGDASSPQIRLSCSAVKLALALVRELHSNSSDVQAWLAHNREHYSSFSPVSKQIVQVITSERLLPPLHSDPVALSSLSLSLDNSFFLDVIRPQSMSPSLALATLHPLPTAGPSPEAATTNNHRQQHPPTYPLQDLLRNDANRYSIVVNALCAITEESASLDYAAEMGAMLADVCASAYPRLADDLLGALGVLCGAGAVAAAQPTHTTSRVGGTSLSRSAAQSQPTMSRAFIDIRLMVTPNLQSDTSSADSARLNIATTVCVLLARSVFSLAELIRLVLLPVLVHAKHAASSGSSGLGSLGSPTDDQDIEEEIETGAMLAFTILETVIGHAELALVGSYPTPAGTSANGNARSSAEMSSQPSPSAGVGLPGGKSASTCRQVGEAYSSTVTVGLSIADLLLLHAHVSTTDCGAMLTVLKALLYLGDLAPPNSGSKSSSSAGRGCSMAGNDHTASELFYTLATSPVVRSRLLADPDTLFRPEMLLDQFLTKEQQRHLVDCLCCAGDDGAVRVSGADPRQRSTLIAILNPLSASTLRRTRLRIQLVYRQVGSTELQQFLDNFGSVVVDMFATASRSQHQKVQQDQQFPERLWFIAPLVASLIECMQSRVLREAWRLLDTAVPPSQLLAKMKEKDRDRLLDTMALVAHPAFVTLVSTLVATRRDQADELAKVLYAQLEKFVQCSFTASGNVPTPSTQLSDGSLDDVTLRHDALRLRLALIGSVLDTGIFRQPNHSLLGDWAVICCLLLTHQVATPPKDSSTKISLHGLLFDLLTCFIHATMVGTDSFTERDENKKAYIATVKKLKREIGECQSQVAREIRRLMPLTRQYLDAFVMEPYGAVFDSTGKQITGLNANARQQGLQIAGTQSLNPWDIVEPGSGWRNCGPISWTWFCARRLDTRPSARFCRLGMLAAYHQPLGLKSNDAAFLEPLPPRQRRQSSSSSSSSSSASEESSPVDGAAVTNTSPMKVDNDAAGRKSIEAATTPVVYQEEVDEMRHASTPQPQQPRQRNSSGKHKMPPPLPTNLPLADGFPTTAVDNLPSATLMMEAPMFPPDSATKQHLPPPPPPAPPTSEQQQPHGQSRRGRKSSEHRQQQQQQQQQQNAADSNSYQTVSTPRPSTQHYQPQPQPLPAPAMHHQQAHFQEMQQMEQHLQQQQQQQQQKRLSGGPGGGAVRPLMHPPPPTHGGLPQQQQQQQPGGNVSSLHDLLAPPGGPAGMVDVPRSSEQQQQQMHHHPPLPTQPAYHRPPQAPPQQIQQAQRRLAVPMETEAVYTGPAPVSSQSQQPPTQQQQQQQQKFHRSHPTAGDSGLGRLLASPNHQQQPQPQPPQEHHFSQQHQQPPPAQIYHQHGHVQQRPPFVGQAEIQQQQQQHHQIRPPPPVSQQNQYGAFQDHMPGPQHSLMQQPRPGGIPPQQQRMPGGPGLGQGNFMQQQQEMLRNRQMQSLQQQQQQPPPFSMASNVRPMPGGPPMYPQQQQQQYAQFVGQQHPHMQQHHPHQHRPPMQMNRPPMPPSSGPY